jgi:hypothetical protein
LSEAAGSDPSVCKFFDENVEMSEPETLDKPLVTQTGREIVMTHHLHEQMALQALKNPVAPLTWS